MSTSSFHPDESDAGFSLVEVLVALAILSALSVALGGMLSFGATLRERAVSADKIAMAVFRLEALRAAIAESAGAAVDVTLAEASPMGFRLVSLTGRRPLPFDVKLSSATAPQIELTYTGASTPQSTEVDLSDFEEARLDYVEERAGRAVWSPGQAGHEYIAARLSVMKNDRTWTVVLWASPRACLQSPSGCAAP